MLDSRSFFLILTIFFSIQFHAEAYRCVQLFKPREPVASDQLLSVPSQESGLGFIVPNEKEIGRVKNQFKQIEEGIYVTVGTERGFMSAALADGRVKSLVLVDRDDRVAAFNLINKALLALAKDRHEYLEMRLNFTFAELAQRLLQKNNLSAENTKTLKNDQLWQWWVDSVQNSNAWSDFHQTNNMTGSTVFAGANYLFEDHLFRVVSSLARQNQIFVIHANLNDNNLPARLLKISDFTKQKISVVDFSNSWQQGYLGHQGTLNLLSSVADLMLTKTSVVLTYLTSDRNAALGRTYFDYAFINLAQIKNINELSLHMGQLTRLDPSYQEVPSRARMGRFGFDD